MFFLVDSSKIGRSRRLQTLKELKFNSNAARENEAPHIRQGWLKPTSSTTAIISKEQMIEMESMGDHRDFSNSMNGDFKPLCSEKDDKDKTSRECEIGRDTDGVANHFAAECIAPNRVECDEKHENVSKNEIRNTVSPTFVQIATLNSSESVGRIKNDSDLVQFRQLPKTGSFHQTDSKENKLYQDTMPRISTCNSKGVHNSMVEIGDCITDEGYANCEGDSCSNVIKANHTLDPFEETNRYSNKRFNHEKCYQALPNSACLNDGFTED